jgi:hypothetical protein
MGDVRVFRKEKDSCDAFCAAVSFVLVDGMLHAVIGWGCACRSV